jgi:glycosyltransferase involved in cell wall biosynthesis
VRPAPLRIIGAGQVDLPGVQIEMRPWSTNTEVADLQECDIGLVPLLDNPWNHWKFFFKTVQYMAVGLAVVARRMGSNAEVIQDGINGFLVDSEGEWYDRLQLLVEDAALRRRMGAAARETVVEQYSTRAHMPRVLEIFERGLQ